MENHASSGARIDPSLVGYMAEDRDNAAAGRQEALISMLPTSTGLAIQPDALPFVIDGEVDLFLATPRAQVSAAQLPQTRAISFINSFQSAFHGWPNDRHQHSVSLQTDFTAASQVQSPPPPPDSDLFDSNVASSVDQSWSSICHCPGCLAWQHQSIATRPISPCSSFTHPSVSSSVDFASHCTDSFPCLSFNSSSWNEQGELGLNPDDLSLFSMPFQAVHQQPQQRCGNSQTTSSCQAPRHTMSPDQAGLETFAVYSPAMSPARISASSAETARQAAALLLLDPGPALGIAEPLPDSHVAVEGLGPTAWGMSLQGPPISQLSSSRGPSRASYNPSETGSSHSLSTYLSQPSSRSRGLPRPAGYSMTRTNSTQSTRPLLPKGHASGRRPLPTPSIVSEKTNASPWPPNSSFSKGKRTGALSDSARKRAKETRERRTVCSWCKLSGITCFPVEGTKWCKKCVDKGRTSSCEAFYFMNLVEEGCTQFTENHSICRQLLLEDDWRFMDFGQLVKHMELLGLSSFILANRGDQTLYELDLSLCHKYLMEASHKLTAQYLIQSFVHEQRKEKGWETCVRIGDDSARDDIGALTLFDDGPVKTTYLIRRHDKTVEICHDKPSLLVANVLSLIFGRQVECAALWRLHKQLPKHQHMSAKHLDFLTRQLLMLRWRVSVDERHRAVLCRQVDRKRIAGRSERDTARTAQMEGLEKRIERDKTLCRKLYVCFCYIRQKRGGTLSTLGDLSHQYAPSPTQCAITEQLPRNDNQEAFDLWIRDGCLAIDEAGLLDMKSVQPPDVELTMI